MYNDVHKLDKHLLASLVRGTAEDVEGRVGELVTVEHAYSRALREGIEELGEFVIIREVPPGDLYLVLLEEGIFECPEVTDEFVKQRLSVAVVRMPRVRNSNHEEKV